MKIKKEPKEIVKKQDDWIGYRAKPEEYEKFIKAKDLSGRTKTSLIREAIEYFVPLWFKKYK